MPHEFFYWLLNMSITATLVGMIVLLLRRIKWFPRRVILLLWLIPFLRMCIPLGVNNQYSFMSLLSKIGTKTVVIYRPIKCIEVSAVNHVQFAESYFPVAYTRDVFEKVFTAAACIWFLVFLAVVLLLGFVYIKTLREMKTAQHCGKNVYYSERVTTPAAYGVIQPKIILPLSYADKDNKFILLHERAHILRGDNLWRLLGLAAAAVHWFNPFAWLFLKLFFADLELACDETVLSTLREEEIKAYAQTLLNSREGANGLVSAFGGARIKNRIENIVSFRKITWLSAVGFGFLFLGIFMTLLPNGV